MIKPDVSIQSPHTTPLGELALDSEERICAARVRLKLLARALGLDQVRATRLAAVTSELSRRVLGQDHILKLALALEQHPPTTWLRIDYTVPGLSDQLPVLSRFFEHIAVANKSECRCLAATPLTAALEPGALDKLREQLQQKSRAELMLDLELQNRALERHRAQLEDTVQERTKQLRAAMASAEDANRAKSDFLSHMSHELRTPLNGVLGHSQILLRDGDATPRQQKSLSAIESSGRHLLTLINDILDLSKIEAGEIVVEETACDLPALTLDVCNIIQPRADKKRVEVRRILGPEVPRCVRTDATKLRQCLVNIAGNAAKFTERGFIELRVNVAGQRLVFEIEDTGVGMSAQELEQLFQPFRQAKAGRSMGGTGLGLAISRSLIQRLGGELQVSSRPEHGTTFRIELPCIVERRASVDPGVSLSSFELTGLHLAHGQHRTLLVVDDNEVNRDVLVGLLEPLGFSLVQARDGLDALDKLRRQTFDLVLMDLRMPRMSGEEALAQIRKDPRLAKTKVMAVTASMEAALMSQLELLGFDAVLSKPFVAGVLFKKVQELTGVSWESSPTPQLTAAAQGLRPEPLSRQTAEQLLPELKQALLVGDLERVARQASAHVSDEPALASWKLRLQTLCEAFDLDGLEAMRRELEEAVGGG